MSAKETITKRYNEIWEAATPEEQSSRYAEMKWDALFEYLDRPLLPRLDVEIAARNSSGEAAVSDFFTALLQRKDGEPKCPSCNCGKERRGFMLGCPDPFHDSPGSAPVPAPQGTPMTPEATSGNSSPAPRLDAPRVELGEMQERVRPLDLVREEHRAVGPYWAGDHPPPATADEKACGCDESRRLSSELADLRERLAVAQRKCAERTLEAEANAPRIAALEACLRIALDDFYGDYEDWIRRAGNLLGDPRLSTIAKLEEEISALRPAAEQTKLAREERDKADGVVAAARAVCKLATPEDREKHTERVEALAKAIELYDFEEIPF